MDPEQIYQEVLQEEQQKGSAAPVAEGRAKSARQRAISGSPHPKEAKWWPGAQPHFEGGDGAAAAPAEEPAAEAAPEPEPQPEPEPAPAAEAPAPVAPAPEAPAAAPAPAAPAPAAPAAAAPAPAEPAASQTVGVTHGTATGTRLRPEDAVASEAQFDGERAMRERRKVIDELVSTGVPAVAAQRTASGSSPFLLLLYILIPAIAIFFLVSQEDELAPAAEPTGQEAPAGGEGGEGGGEAPAGDLTVVASGTAFDTDTLTLAAEGESSIHFVNEDTVPHNIAIYEDDSASAEIFVGELITDDETDYAVPGPGQPGEAYFQCDVHPTMSGSVTFE